MVLSSNGGSGKSRYAEVGASGTLYWRLDVLGTVSSSYVLFGLQRECVNRFLERFDEKAVVLHFSVHSLYSCIVEFLWVYR